MHLVATPNRAITGMVAEVRGKFGFHSYWQILSESFVWGKEIQTSSSWKNRRKARYLLANRT